MTEIQSIFYMWGLDTVDVEKICYEISAKRLETSLRTIHRYLQHLFPQKEICSGWMTKPNGAFDGRRPIDLILEDGELGLDVVEKYLAGAMQR